jgi:ribosome-binding protein aMBF1 (putative translation factor)
MNTYSCNFCGLDIDTEITKIITNNNNVNICIHCLLVANKHLDKPRNAAYVEKAANKSFNEEMKKGRTA